MEPEENRKPIILVYFRLRGKLQPIRNIIAYLGLPFFEVHLDDETQRKSLDREITNSLRGLKIDKSSLPLMVYEGRHIYETLPIMNFICRRFGAESLMGRNIRQRARINEFLDSWIYKEANIVGDLFKLAEQSLSRGQDVINRDKLLLYDRWINESGYIAELCALLSTQPEESTFVFREITLIDFFFVETCHYMLGIFSSLLDEQGRVPEKLLKLLKGASHLSSIRNYVSLIENEPFYRDNRTYLQSFSIATGSFSIERRNGLKKIWGGNLNFIS